ncbi:NgoPII family restriction endonuclease [Myxosarcina sp. GI1(2024)]
MVKYKLLNKEIGRVNRVDPLGITHLRIRINLTIYRL